jgi:hypothetical protein
MSIEPFACSATYRTNGSCILGYDCWKQSTVSKRPIAEPKPKMSLQHNTYSLQQSTYMEDLFWVLGEHNPNLSILSPEDPSAERVIF